MPDAMRGTFAHGVETEMVREARRVMEYLRKHFLAEVKAHGNKAKELLVNSFLRM